MRMIVDISDTLMEYIIKGRDLSKEQNNEIACVIANGTPLPVHHGRLGDLDALEAEMINGIKSGNYEEGYEEYAHINDMDDCIECVRYAPTIIEGK